MNTPSSASSKPSAVNVLYDADVSTYDIPDEGDEYARPSTSTSYYITGAEMVIDHESEPFNCLCATRLYQGQEIFVLTAISSTGDSFGHDDGGSIDFLAVFTTEQRALKAQSQIQAHYDITQLLDRYRPHDAFKTLLQKIPLLPNPPSLVPDTGKKQNHFIGNGKVGFDLSKFNLYSASFHNDAGEVEEVSTSWVGYFESLNSLDIDRLVLEPPKLFKEKTFKIGKIK